MNPGSALPKGGKRFRVMAFSAYIDRCNQWVCCVWVNHEKGEQLGLRVMLFLVIFLGEG